MIQDKFPVCVLIDFGNADEEGWPEISRAIAFKEPLGEIADAFSVQESRRYVREDVVSELVEALGQARIAIDTLSEGALGIGTKEDRHGGIDYRPYKMELLHQINNALASFEKEVE